MRDFTVGASLPRIHALCSDIQYIWPWRKGIKKEIDEIQDGLGSLESRKADRSEIPLPSAPKDEQPSYDDKPLAERIVALESWKVAVEKTDVMQDDNLKHLNNVIEQIKATAEEYAKSEDPEKKALAAAVADVKSKVDALEPKVKEAADLIAPTAEAVAKKAAGEAVPALAEAAAEKVVEAATPGLLERLRGLLPEGLAAKVEAAHNLAAGMKGWLFGSYAGLGVLAAFMLWIFKDVRDYIKTGGEDKLTIQKLAERLEKLADRTSNKADDAAAGALGSVADRLAGLIDRLAKIERKQEIT